MADPVLRAKVRVVRVVHVKQSDGSTEQEEVQLQAVTSDTPENKQWSRWTPSAQFALTINNPAAYGKLSSGHEFYVDFTPVK